VAYLHGLKIVHGDLKGVGRTSLILPLPRRQAEQANILVDDTGTARIADFGHMAMVELSTVFLSETVVSCGGTFCWMAPELLDPSRFNSDGRPTRESDCYALGMVIYEVSWLCSLRLSLIHPSQVLTGLRPFHRLYTYEPVPAILRGQRPEKPLDAESLGLSCDLWGLVQSCWSELSSTRPTAQRLFDHLSPVSLAWAPPPVYPANGVDAEGITDSDSSGSLF